MPIETSISTTDVRECLERSGYLMESRLVRSLSSARFFVEPNVAHRDPRTGKSREIDLIAEDVGGCYRAGVSVKTTFVIEAVNNRYPIVLLTERPSTPNADFENYVKFSWTPVNSPLLEKIHVYEEKNANWDDLFSQYCALTRKSGREEFMASHPDDMYTSLQKLAEYTQDELANFEEWTSKLKDAYWRLFFWHPMLVVSGQLMTAKVAEDGNVQLQEVPLARLEFNWHDADTRRTTVIEVIREDFLLQRMETIRNQDEDIEGRMFVHRNEQKPLTGDSK